MKRHTGLIGPAESCHSLPFSLLLFFSSSLDICFSFRFLPSSFMPIEISFSFIITDSRAARQRACFRFLRPAEGREALFLRQERDDADDGHCRDRLA